jgi:hypothetical protein
MTDGARIAYTTVDSGPALIFVQPFSHLVLEWEERVRDFWEIIGQYHTVVRYDGHGCGLRSQQERLFARLPDLSGARLNSRGG